MDEGMGHHMTTLNEKSCISLTDHWDGFSVTIVLRLLVHFYFLIPVAALCPPEKQRGGQSVDNCTSCTQNCVHTVALCWTWSAYTTSVSAQVKPGVCSCFCLLLVKRSKAKMFILCTLYEYWIQKESRGEEVECKHFTIRLVFYRMRYLKCYILGPTWKMFDVHILSINVGIHYKCFNKVFFFPWKNALTMYVKEKENISVNNCNAICSLTAPQHSCHREHLYNGRSVAQLSCWLTVCAHSHNK